MMNLIPNSNETICGLAPNIQSRKISCVEVLSNCLAKIDELEHQVQAWVSVERNSAMKVAEALDVEMAEGIYRGPLHGIPVGIKDIIDVASWPTAAGANGWKEKIALDDAFLVQRLREAGAIILGKTVTTEYASFDPPVTANPWNLARTPGGSSSGSAAAVATGMCLAAIGSQTGGSITRPATYCGVAGCKPTYGRVSVRGILPLAANLDHPGPIAHCVDDLRIMLNAIAGYDLQDPWSKEATWNTIASASFSKAPNLGRLSGIFADMAVPAVKECFENSVIRFQDAGANVSPTKLPNEFDEVIAQHLIIMASEAAAVHEERYRAEPEEYGPCISQLINQGLETSTTDYVRAREHQVKLKRSILECFQDVDALLCPATTGPAPDRTTTGNPAFNSPWSHTGLPTVSIPVGLSPEGLPLGIQIVGRPFAEEELFKVAHWCESVIRSA